MKKSFLYVIIWLLLAYAGGFSCTHAQSVQWTQGDSQDTACNNSTICGTAPEKFTLMLDFVREMANSIKTIGTKGDYLWEYVNPNRFKGNDFDPPEMKTVGKVARSVEQKLKFGAAAATIFTNITNIGGLKDVFGSTILAFKNKVFLRDSKLVQEMESLLSDKKYEIWLWWWRYSEISQENMAIMDTIMKSYKNKWLFSDYSLTKWVTYNNITSLLTRMLSSMKSFVYSNSQFDESNKIKDEYVEITFAPDVKNSIEREYICVDVCDKNKTSNQSFLQIFKTKFDTSLSDNKKIFMDAVKRLGTLFSKEKQQDDEAYQNREYDLLMATYGQSKRKDGVFLNRIDFNYDDNVDFSEIWSVMRSWKMVPNTVADQIDEIKSAQEDLVSNVSDDPTSLKGDEYFEQELLSYVFDVFQQQQIDHDLTAYHEIKDVTPAFNIIWQQIYVIKNEIIGDKDKDNSLVKNLWEACETQCGRWWTCR